MKIRPMEMGIGAEAPYINLDFSREGEPLDMATVDQIECAGVEVATTSVRWQSRYLLPDADVAGRALLEWEATDFTTEAEEVDVIFRIIYTDGRPETAPTKLRVTVIPHRQP